MKNLLEIAITASLEAGKKVLEVYNSSNYEIEIKSDNSPLTLADKLSHKTIMSYLNITNIPVLSEEGKLTDYNFRKDWNQLWIVDPLDGTKEFIKRNGDFTVNIAFVSENKLQIGVIFVPVKSILYFSSFDQGSYKTIVDLNNFSTKNLIENALKLPINRSNKNFTIVTSRSHISKDTIEYIQIMNEKHSNIDFIKIGSSLKFCMVAEGKADCYPRFSPTMEWDTAAGQAICEHAGFNVINWHTKKKIKYNRLKLLNDWFIVN